MEWNLIRALAIVGVCLLIGCSVSNTKDKYSHSPPTATQPATTTYERSIHSGTFADWTGPSATEAASRQKGFEINADGSVESSGSKWTFADSIGTWMTKQVAYVSLTAGLLAVFGIVASLLKGSGGIIGFVRGLGQMVSGLIPGVGAIVQRVLRARTAGSLVQVVAGVDEFKTMIYASSMKQAEKDKLWTMCKTALQKKQDTSTQHVVNAIRNGG